MTKNTDLRIIRTLESIREAFVTLIVEKGFDQISVRDLCQRAKINRATFYRHYSDKYDLANQMTDILFEDNRIDDPNAYMAESVNPILRLFEHAEQYRPFYLAMLGPKGIPGFQDRVRQQVETEMSKLIDALAPSPPASQFQKDVAVRYMAAAQVGFIQWWLENDMPITKEEATDYLTQLHQVGGFQALNITLK